MLDSAEELYKWFTQQVMINLHVVLTMNPSSEGLKSRAATSPALFNRCVLNWFGDWSTGALYQVGQSFTSKVDLERSGVWSSFFFSNYNIKAVILKIISCYKLSFSDIDEDNLASLPKLTCSLNIINLSQNFLHIKLFLS